MDGWMKEKDYIERGREKLCIYVQKAKEREQISSEMLMMVFIYIFPQWTGTNIIKIKGKVISLKSRGEEKSGFATSHIS